MLIGLFAASLMVSFLTGVLLRRIPWPVGIGMVISIAAGLASPLVIVIPLITKNPLFLTVLMLGARPIIVTLILGSSLGGFASFKNRAFESGTSAALILAILYFPIIFAWFTLKKGYSTLARVTTFAWLSLFCIVLAKPLITQVRIASGDVSVCSAEPDQLKCWAEAAIKSNRPELCNSYRHKFGFSNEPEACINKMVDLATDARTCEKIEAVGEPYEAQASRCFTRFPSSRRTHDRCGSAWKKGDLNSIFALKCWTGKNINTRIPGSDLTPLLLFFQYNTNGSSGDLDVILALKPDLNAKNGEGQTALHLARDSSSAEQLLNAGAFPNAKDNSSLTPPMSWVARGNVSILQKFIVETLLQARWIPNQADQAGDTVLHKIAQAPMLTSSTITDFEKKIVADLISAGADPTIKNSAGKTPVDIANERQLSNLFH
jgi:hypothetical protein